MGILIDHVRGPGYTLLILAYWIFFDFVTINGFCEGGLIAPIWRLPLNLGSV